MRIMFFFHGYLCERVYTAQPKPVRVYIYGSTFDEGKKKINMECPRGQKRAECQEQIKSNVGSSELAPTAGLEHHDLVCC